MTTMRAVGAFGALPADHPEALVDLRIDVPRATGRDLLVAVRAVSVNPVDTKVRRGLATSDVPRVLGWDAAGVVAAVGEDVRGFRVGDEVWFAGDVTRPGSNAEFTLVDERIVGRKPRRASFAEAAALPLTALTAYEAYFDRMRVPRGDRGRGRSLLVVGGAGGVGSIAIQLAKQLTAMTVIATASRPESRAWALAQGADLVVDHAGDVRAELEAIGHATFDYALCTSDTDPYVDLLLDGVAPQGVVCFIVPPTKPMDLGRMHAKSASVAWELVYTRSRFRTADMAEQGRILSEVADLVDAGRIRTTMSESTGPIGACALRAAHARLESRVTIGKLVIEGW